MLIPSAGCLFTSDKNPKLNVLRLNGQMLKCGASINKYQQGLETSLVVLGLDLGGSLKGRLNLATLIPTLSQGFKKPISLHLLEFKTSEIRFAELLRNMVH